jgi:uncharacterized protein YjbK|tara:strand:+ start:191 stop:376 length:186 start_codon:yes stop_codon:yes gene_type:complete
MKNLLAQALIFQYKLQIENAQDVIKSNNATLKAVDQALNEVIVADQKIKVLGGIVQNTTRE